ncbi:MAG TPA: SMI1/KNR4 family protein [Pirellulales bacterium]|nr:SMI1/KNR4 family protein [Pirellulales bacterium]
MSDESPAEAERPIHADQLASLVAALRIRITSSHSYVDALDKLLQLPDVQAAPPATRSEIDAFSKAAKLAIPKEVVDLYQTCNGASLRNGVLDIRSTSASLAYLEGMRAFGIPQRWGYLPIVENNDSNPWCICCNEPLCGYIVQVNHDDNAAIKFRSLDRFVAAISRQVECDEPFLYKMPADFDTPVRTTQDIDTARRLLQTAEKLVDLERFDALHFAVTLFSDDETNEIVALLDDRDEYVREVAIRRLRRINTPEARRAVREGLGSMRSFVAHCATVLTEAGIRASIHGDVRLRLDDGPIWLNVEMFFGRRHEPEFIEFFIDRAKKLLETAHTRKPP